MTAPFRIFATGDLHVDEHSDRFDECKRILDWIASYVEAATPAPDAVLISGDIYERNSTPAERLVAASLVRRCADVCRVIIVRGNHDRKRDLALLAALASTHPIYVVEGREIVSLLTQSGVTARIACMGWPTRANVTMDGAAKDALRNVLADIGAQLAPCSGPKILLGHFDVAGAKVGEGQPMIGGALTLGLEDLALAGADAVVMGHIHKPQEWLYNRRPIIYCGTPFRTDFGEPEDKSILSIEIDGDKVSWERIPTPARDMILAEASYTDGAFRLVEEPVSVRNADIRIHYAVPKEHRDAAMRLALDIGERWKASGAATVKIDDELVVVARAREEAVAVAAARTTEEKLLALWASTGRMPVPAVKERILGRYARIAEAS